MAQGFFSKLTSSWNNLLGKENNNSAKIDSSVENLSEEKSTVENNEISYDGNTGFVENLSNEKSVESNENQIQEEPIVTHPSESGNILVFDKVNEKISNLCKSIIHNDILNDSSDIASVSVIRLSSKNVLGLFFDEKQLNQEITNDFLELISGIIKNKRLLEMGNFFMDDEKIVPTDNFIKDLFIVQENYCMFGKTLKDLLFVVVSKHMSPVLGWKLIDNFMAGVNEIEG